MLTNDFQVLQTILDAIHLKTFDEPLSKLSRSKAQMLSWVILEATGEMLSYKSLINYFDAVLQVRPERINPNLSTLLILAEYATGQAPETKPPLARWRDYRNRILGDKNFVAAPNS